MNGSEKPRTSCRGAVTAAHEALIEKVARALFEKRVELIASPLQRIWTELAREAVALVYAEMQTVTPEMEAAALEAHISSDEDGFPYTENTFLVWSAALAASPLNPGGE